MATGTTQTTKRAPTPRVTISDVSDALGVTKSTVSRALNGYSDISPATQVRVSRMAEKMGYVPLSHAQAIKTGRTRSLGLVIQLADHDAHRPFLAEFLSGLSRGASDAGWTLTVATSDSEAGTLETMGSLRRDRKADGFILPRTMYDDPRVAYLRETETPFVMFGRTRNTDDCAWFDVLGEDAMTDGAIHLAGLGHDRIAFINGSAAYTYGVLRHDGFLRGMKQARLTADPALIRSDAFSTADGQAAALELLRADAPPTAFVCATDTLALGVYAAAAQLGLTIGQDISVISYDGLPEGATTTPPLTTYAVNFRASGIRLAELLIRRIRGEDPQNLRETVAPTFTQRASTAPPNLSSAALGALLGQRL